jgi:hypothetical protein
MAFGIGGRDGGGGGGGGLFGLGIGGPSNRSGYSSNPYAPAPTQSYPQAFGGEMPNLAAPLFGGKMMGNLQEGLAGAKGMGGGLTGSWYDRKTGRQAMMDGTAKRFNDPGRTRVGPGGGPGAPSFSTQDKNFQTPRQPRAEFPDVAPYQHPQSQPMQINQDIMAAIMGPQPGPMQPGGPTQPMQSASSVHQLIGGNGQPPTPNLIGGAGPVGTIPNFNGTP